MAGEEGFSIVNLQGQTSSGSILGPMCKLVQRRGHV